MPWKSDSQRKWGHTPEGIKALGGRAAVSEWDAATEGKSLPEKKGKWRQAAEKRVSSSR